MQKLNETKQCNAAIGIGAMVVFIAIVFVAGVAASVIVQVSTDLERATLTTGQDTLTEVATAIKIDGVEGMNQSGIITKLAIEVSTRAGSPDIDLENALIEISDSSKKIVLEFGTSAYVNASSLNGNMLSNGNFGTATTFGINVLQDADGSCSSSTPIINFGDHVFLGVNVTSVFSENAGLLPRTDVFGEVIIEEGAPGLLGFTTPSAYSEDIIELQ